MIFCVSYLVSRSNIKFCNYFRNSGISSRHDELDSSLAIDPLCGALSPQRLQDEVPGFSDNSFKLDDDSKLTASPKFNIDIAEYSKLGKVTFAEDHSFVAKENSGKHLSPSFLRNNHTPLRKTSFNQISPCPDNQGIPLSCLTNERLACRSPLSKVGYYYYIYIFVLDYVTYAAQHGEGSSCDFST